MYLLCTGDYIIVEPIAEGNKVQAQIVHILYPQQIKFLKEDKKWLAVFKFMVLCPSESFCVHYDRPFEFDAKTNGVSANGKENW